MASATSSRGPKRGTLDVLAACVTQAATIAPVAVLVLRMPQFEREAWVRGRAAAQQLERLTQRAFLRAGRYWLRSGDVLAHDAGSDVFAVALTAGSRRPRVPGAADCRAVLVRLGAAIEKGTQLAPQTGWRFVRADDAGRPMDEYIAQALEQGARERERYEFFAAVGHELRTPLSSIRGYLETVLDDDAASPGQARRFLEIARRETLRLGRLLDGMFEVSLLDLSGGCASHGCTGLGAALTRACENAAPAARRRGVSIVSEEVGEVAVRVNEDACVQIFTNILENAIKHGRKSGSIAINAHAAGGHAVVRIDDDGPGIAMHEWNRVFEAGIRGSDAHAPGSGLGLAIVKAIVLRAGGGVCVSRSPLGGARFELTLPLQAESSAPAS